jgi:tRNA-dihydrouridine synthase B
MSLGFDGDIRKMLQRGGAVLAPMAGITDYPMRKLCHQAGALWCVSEMISAKAVVYNNQRTLQLARVFPDEGPVALQLFGSDPDVIFQAVEALQDGGARMIDLNMGCPTPKIVRNGDGAALMQDLHLAGEVIAAARSASKLLLTVKMRSGWDYDQINAPALAKIAQMCGADAIAVHPRVRSQMYEGVPDWRVVEEVCREVTLPVLASGNIHSYEEAVQVMQATGASGVMVGRGALGDPWIFTRIRDGFAGRQTLPPSIFQRIDGARLHLELALNEGPERVVVAEMRKHIAWYIKGIRGAAALRARVNCCETASSMRLLLAEAADMAANGYGGLT